MIKEIFEYTLMIAGLFFIVSGAIGIYRFPDVFSRSHAATLIDTVGASLLLLGLAIHNGFDLNLFKLLYIFILLWFANTVNGHLLTRIGLKLGLKPLSSKNKLMRK